MCRTKKDIKVGIKGVKRSKRAAGGSSSSSSSPHTPAGKFSALSSSVFSPSLSLRQEGRKEGLAVAIALALAFIFLFFHPFLSALASLLFSCENNRSKWKKNKGGRN
jgi:hypothetical protein